jgi:DNA primase
VFCPRHDHHKRKLCVNLERDVFHCWVCGWSGKTLEPILRLKRGSAFYQEYVAEHHDEHEKNKKEYAKVLLPKEFRPLTDELRSPWYRQARKYLDDRGVGLDLIRTYKLGYCEEGEYKNRIIIPSFDEYGDLNFFVGRLFMGEGLKYKHGVFCKDIIFNDYLIDWSYPITLVEGPFDALKSGPNSIPLLGTGLNENTKVFHKIVESKQPVYVALDSDAWDQAQQVIQKLVAYGSDAYYVDMRGFKDPGDMSREQFGHCLNLSTHIKTSVDLMKLQVFHSGTRNA